MSLQKEKRVEVGRVTSGVKMTAVRSPCRVVSGIFANMGRRWDPVESRAKVVIVRKFCGDDP